MKIELLRTYYTSAVNGILLIEGVVLCKTIELPWRENQPRISCIPEGQYLLRKRQSARFKAHFEVMGVQGRKYILIHPANDAAAELRGCIAPVLEHTGEGRGSASRAALQRMKDRLFPVLESGHSIVLIIKNALQ